MPNDLTHRKKLKFKTAKKVAPDGGKFNFPPHTDLPADKPEQLALCGPDDKTHRLGVRLSLEEISSDGKCSENKAFDDVESPIHSDRSQVALGS